MGLLYLFASLYHAHLCWFVIKWFILFLLSSLSYFALRVHSLCRFFVAIFRFNVVLLFPQLNRFDFGLKCHLWFLQVNLLAGLYWDCQETQQHPQRIWFFPKICHIIWNEATSKEVAAPKNRFVSLYNQDAWLNHEHNILYRQIHQLGRAIDSWQPHQPYLFQPQSVPLAICPKQSIYWILQSFEL